MRRLAGCGQNDFGAAPLPPFQIQGRGFANHDIVGIDLLHDFGQAQPFKRFFADRSGNINRPRQFFRNGRQRRQSIDHSGKGAFHVAGAATVDPAFPDHSFEWRNVPFRSIRYIHRIDVSVE